MTFAITLKPSYLTDVLTLPRDVGKRLEAVLGKLQEDPAPRGDAVKKLRGYRNVYRYRVGDHRLIYALDLEAHVVKLLAIGLRKTIYGRFRAAPEVPIEPVPVQVAEEVEPDSKAGDSEEAAALPGGAELDPGSVPGDESDRAIDPEPLPPISRGLLSALRVPDEHVPDLLRCVTDMDLYSAPVPDAWKDRVLDALLPKPIAQVQTQPDLVLEQPGDLTKFLDGTLFGFLLRLDPEQEALARRSLVGPALIKGGPGSGKSTVALHRARALVERGVADGRPPSVLFTTYTNALVTASEQLLRSLLGDLPHELSVRTVDGLVAMILRDAEGKRYEVAGADDCRQALAAARRARGQEGSADLQAFLAAATADELPAEFLQDEFDWVIEGQGLASLDAYLKADRPLRKVRLAPATRRRVWGIYERYRRHLEERGLETWGGLRRRALEAVRGGRYGQRWDYVLVDEAQDLAPVALRLCVEVCRGPEGLFLAADAGQSIYNRGFAWSHVHEALQLRGRTRILRRNYRTTLQLGRASADLLRRGGTSDPETVELDAVREGPRPVVKACVDREAQYQWLAARIQETARALRLPPWSAGVLCPTRSIAQEAADALRKAGLPARFMEGRTLRLDGNEVKVLTMHSAKGLEFPVVGLPAVEAGLVPLATDARDDVRGHEDEQRRLLYVAMSRAMRQLFVATTRGQASPFLGELSAEHWDLRLGP